MEELAALPCQLPDLLILDEAFHADKKIAHQHKHFNNCLSGRSDIFFSIPENKNDENFDFIHG